MKFKELAEMSSEELQTKKRDMRQESLHLRLQQQSGQLEQPSRLRLLRRDVARVETVLGHGRRRRKRNKDLWRTRLTNRTQRRRRVYAERAKRGPAK